MAAAGLWMLAAVAVAMALTGLPAWVVLLGVSLAGSMVGIGAGAFDLSFVTGLPSRLVGLLENDLLQALPLYALVGALLNRLPLAAQMHRGGQSLLRGFGAAPEMSALAVGALLAPMNGSVGASLHMLSRSMAPRLAASGTPPAAAAATLCVAGTLGVVVPPSLVLLLLGDAMMRAHTEAVNASHAAVRIVNTQDVMRAALVPGALVLALSLAIVGWRARHRPRTADAQWQPRDALVTGLVVAVIAGLLGAVAVGRLYAVEAAACGALMLVLHAATQLDRPAWQAVLRDTMSLTSSFG